MKKFNYKKSIYSAFILSFVLLAFNSNISAGETSKDTIKVAGNCEMCQKRIISAASIKGVKSLNWSPETQLLTIQFNPEKTKLDEIEKKIAGSGHDTPNYKGDDEAYEQLHGCCQYPRLE